ncbi:MAG: hypothetical protein WAM14_10300 [Candidatus Nitrosopolaris sp.]
MKYLHSSQAIRAAKSERVVLNELKFAVIRAIGILLSRINSDDGVADALKASRLALERTNYSSSFNHRILF